MARPLARRLRAAGCFAENLFEKELAHHRVLLGLNLGRFDERFDLFIAEVVAYLRARVAPLGSSALLAILPRNVCWCRHLVSIGLEPKCLYYITSFNSSVCHGCDNAYRQTIARSGGSAVTAVLLFMALIIIFGVSEGKFRWGF